MSSESIKFHRMNLTMIQTWFRILTPGYKNFIHKVNIFCIGNGHIHTFDASTKIVQIGWGHFIDFRVWKKKTAVTFVEWCIAQSQGISKSIQNAYTLLSMHR